MKLKIYALPCGQVGVDPCVPDRSLSRNPLAYTGLLRSPRRRIWLPVKAFLIVHPQGRILVDTGWDAAVRHAPVRTLTYPLWFASKPRLPAGQAIDEQLAQLGLSPADLTAVLMTHLDIDHCSGLRLVRGAPAVYASAQELAALRSAQVRYSRRPLRGAALQPVPFAPDPAAPYRRSWDIFGDGTVKALFLPGHTQGSLAVKAEHAGRFVLLVGDTGYRPASWQQGKLPGPVYSAAMMERSLRWVRRQAADPRCAAVLAAHDAAETRRCFTL